MIVRNSMTADQWSKEEELYLEGPFPFAIGSPFDLMLCHKPEGVSVAVNGQMAFEFKHRMDPNLIDALEITGAQMITSIQYEFL
ncbi:Galectin [Tyrophagus putrescentiae]|nr:Galectin [Tyrophagus putrescentiae]